MVRLRHIGIVTQDIDRLIPYYTKVCGGKIINDHTEQVRIVKLDNGIELIQYESQSENNLRKVGISHIAFTQDPNGNYLEVVTENETVK